MYKTILIVGAVLYLILWLTVEIMAKKPKERKPPKIIHVHKTVVKAPREPHLTPFQKIDLRNKENMKHRFYSHDYRR